MTREDYINVIALAAMGLTLMEKGTLEYQEAKDSLTRLLVKSAECTTQ